MDLAYNEIQTNSNKKILFSENDKKYKLSNNLEKINKSVSTKRLLSLYSSKYYQKFLFTKEKSKSQSFIIGKYVYKKKYLKKLNIIYCSNTNFINKNISHFFQILSKKFNISLCGEYFISKKNAIFKNNLNLFLTKNKIIFLKKIPHCFTFDLLYSESEF